MRRSGENLAATVLHLRAANPGRFQDLEDMLRIVSDCNMESLDFSWTDEGQVMLALDEGRGRRTTARLMSDGTLRFSAVVTALMTASTSLDIGASGPAGPTFDAPAPGIVLAIGGDRERSPPLSRGASARPGRECLPAAGCIGTADDAQPRPPRRNQRKGAPGCSRVPWWSSLSPDRSAGVCDRNGRRKSRARGEPGGLVAAETRSADDYSGFLHMIGTVS